MKSKLFSVLSMSAVLFTISCGQQEFTKIPVTNSNDNDAQVVVKTPALTPAASATASNAKAELATTTPAAEATLPEGVKELISGDVNYINGADTDVLDLLQPSENILIVK